MSIELDHVLAFVDDAESFELGLRPSYRRVHPGQGTRNLCFCLDNAFIELLERDPNQEAIDEDAHIGFAQRANWRTSGASPLGLAVRAPTTADLPFPSWPYTPAYLPASRSIAMATSSTDLTQPLLFSFPGARRPDQSDRLLQRCEAEIVGVHIVTPAPGQHLLALQQLALCDVDTGPPALTLTLSTRRGGGTRDVSIPL